MGLSTENLEGLLKYVRCTAHISPRKRFFYRFFLKIQYKIPKKNPALRAGSDPASYTRSGLSIDHALTGSKYIVRTLPKKISGFPGSEKNTSFRGYSNLVTGFAENGAGPTWRA